MLASLFRRWEIALAHRDDNRMVRPFEWGTEFIQKDVRLHDPRRSLLDHAREWLARSDSYFTHSAVTDYRIEGAHLTFTSPLRTGSEVNDTVHGWYFQSGAGDRAVLVVPQWNANAESHMSLARILNRLGFSSMRLSLPYHDLRMPKGLRRADYMLSSNLGRTLQSVRQAVLDCRAALDWLESQGHSKFAILGTSLGSCIALLALAHDRRLSTSVHNHISPFFADVVWTGISTRHVRVTLERSITLDDLREIWMPISPKAYLARLVGTGKKSLLVHARYDQSFLPSLSRQVLRDYRDLELPHSVLELPCGHYTSGRFPFSFMLGYAICAYLRKNL